MKKDVHTEHCCLKHGCKYGSKDCTVTTEKKPQSFPCETCDFVVEENRNRLDTLKEQVVAARERIDALLPSGVLRTGPIELSLTFEPSVGWYAYYSYRIARRLVGSKFSTTEPALSAEDALTDLIKRTALVAKNTGKRLGDLW